MLLSVSVIVLVLVLVFVLKSVLVIVLVIVIMLVSVLVSVTVRELPTPAFEGIEHWSIRLAENSLNGGKSARAKFAKKNFGIPNFRVVECDSYYDWRV